MSTYHWRKSSSVLLPCWKVEVCDKDGSLTTSTPDDICGTLPKLLLAFFWFLHFPDLRTWPWSPLLLFCPGCWVSSSCLGGCPDPRLLCWSWTHRAFHAVFLTTWRRVIRRQQTSGSWDSLPLCRSVWCLCVFPAIASGRFPMSIAGPCWIARMTVGLPASFSVRLEMHRSLCLSELFLLAGCRAVAVISHMLVWHRKTAGSSIMQSVWFGVFFFNLFSKRFLNGVLFFQKKGFVFFKKVCFSKCFSCVSRRALFFCLSVFCSRGVWFFRCFCCTKIFDKTRVVCFEKRLFSFQSVFPKVFRFQSFFRDCVLIVVQRFLCSKTFFKWLFFVKWFSFQKHWLFKTFFVKHFFNKFSESFFFSQFFKSFSFSTFFQRDWFFCNMSSGFVIFRECFLQ